MTAPSRSMSFKDRLVESVMVEKLREHREAEPLHVHRGGHREMIGGARNAQSQASRH